MLTCNRCSGFIDTTHQELFDPSCINCGCTYPELGPSENRIKKERTGLREAIRYSGSIPDRKDLLGYITYSRHPSKITVSPRLIVECPMCTKKAEVLTTLADPSVSYTRHKLIGFVRGYKTARQSITCPEGHSFRLRINEEGVYSWAE